MAVANIRAIITAQDNASAVVRTFGTNVGKSSDKVTESTGKMQFGFAQLAVVTAAAGLAAHKLFGVIEESVTAANKGQAALIGLNSVAKAFGQNADDAKKAAQELAKDGLMTVTDAAAGLKNLLGAGFDLPQAIKLMERFKDSAAFGRQGMLEFGESIVGATQGIKNGNSIMVDNAGVTKNLSIILEQAGFSAQDLMRATTDTNVRMALFNGILKETNPQVGDAARLVETFAGKQAELTAKTTVLKQEIGEALQPALLRVLEVITPLIERFAKFTEDHPQIVAAVLLITTGLIGLAAIVGAVTLAITGLGLTMGAIAGISLTVLGPLGLLAGGFIAIQLAADAAGRAINNANRAIDQFGATQDAALRRAQQETDPVKKQALIRAIQSGNRQQGGAVSRGSTYMVGERRPEIFEPREAGRIIPQPKMGGGGTVINISPNIGIYAGSPIERRKLALQLWNDLKDVANQQNTTVNNILGSTNVVPIG